MPIKGLKTEKKPVVVSKKGGKSDTRQTKSAFDRNNALQKELETPISQKAEIFIVDGNLKRNGIRYKTGDMITCKLTASIQALIDLGRLKTEKEEEIEEEVVEEEVVTEEENLTE